MADQPNRVGQQLGNYRLIRLLGEGGFAEVYLGKHIHLETQAAIKVLHTQLTSNDIETFRTEARMIARFVHPHIVRVLEFEVEGKTPFLVMDYAPGGTLRERHPKGSIVPVTTVVSYVKQMAEALQYAHDERLVHRDIKPENMLLDRNGNVLLSDFGIALVAQSSHHQSTQGIMGTVAYMSPEQIQGKARPASDQYSLGVVVYEWLCGDRPFHGSFVELCTQQVLAPPPPLREKAPMISPDLEQVVMTALAKDPKQRFTSVQAFAAALQQASEREQKQPFVLPREGIMSRETFSPDVLMLQPNPPPPMVVSPSSYPLRPERGQTSYQYPQPPQSASSQNGEAGNDTVLSWSAQSLDNINGQVHPIFKYTSPVTEPSKRKADNGRRRLVVALLATGGIAATFYLLSRSGTVAPPANGSTAQNTRTTPTATQTQQPTHIGVVIGMTDMAVNSSKMFTNTDGAASLLIRLPDGNFVAYESACTHQGVIVIYYPETQQLMCPRHGSIFDPANAAAVLRGPAALPLLQVAIRVNTDGTVTTGG